MLIHKEKQKNKNINFKNKNIEKKYTWYDWLINYIPEPIKKIVGGFKDKVVNLFNTNTSKQTVSGTGNKLIKPKTQKQSEENLINIIRNCFIQKNETKVKKNKDRIIIIFEEEENYYKLKRVSKFWNNNYTEYGSNGDRNTNLSLGGSKKKPAARKKPASKNPGRGRGRARGSTGRGRGKGRGRGRGAKQPPTIKGKVETKKRKENEPKSEAKTKKPKKDCLINLRAYSHQRMNYIYNMAMV